MKCLTYLLLCLLLAGAVIGQEMANSSPEKATTEPTDDVTVAKTKIPAGSKLYVAPMEGGFENFVIAGIQKKKVPVVVVVDRNKADFELTGIAESEKAGWAKMLFMGSQQSKEQASIKVANIKTGAVVFGYSVHKGNSYKGKQSAGEACAKHLKQAIE
ncbi:MAG TPA: hypothetical protein VD837_04110 [Terriglobales bacterium]|nr:hypothetical protein [Terriglobales bacterium]